MAITNLLLFIYMMKVILVQAQLLEYVLVQYFLKHNIILIRKILKSIISALMNILIRQKLMVVESLRLPQRDLLMEEDGVQMEKI